jgi:3-oxoacyl-[acyl-carrier protein] reductase
MSSIETGVSLSDALDFAGNVVLVTGGGSGIGAGIARAFAAQGAAVAINDIRPDFAASIADSLPSKGSETLAVAADVSDKGMVAAMIDAVLERFGRLDIVVNNADIKTNRPELVSSVLEMPEELWDRVLDVNLKGPMLVCQAAARAMIELEITGSIVNVTSGSAFSARASAGHYCASKAGLAMLTRVLAIELAQFGIRVNAVAPGMVLTDESDQTEARRRYLETMRAGIPLGRFGSAEEIAQAILFLASPAAAFITGEQISVNGGSHAGRNLPRSA